MIMIGFAFFSVEDNIHMGIFQNSVPMSLRSILLIYLRNLLSYILYCSISFICPLSHTHIHTTSLSYSLSHTYSLTHSLYHTHSHTLPQSLFLTQTLSLSLSHSLTDLSLRCHSAVTSDSFRSR